MTTYTTIANTEIDQDSPVTQPLMTALRDNPIAIAEADSSVSATLLPTVLLGTIATTSGSSVSLTSLDLTPFKFLTIVFDQVSHNDVGTSRNLGLAGQQVTTSAIAASDAATGLFRIDLSDGLGMGALALSASGTAGSLTVRSFGITTATTSISVSVLVSGSFDSGAVRVYGEK